jgi:hypothetical protein
MWNLEKIADAYDQLEKWDNKNMNAEIRLWTESNLYHDSNGIHNLGVYFAGQTLYALNVFTTSIPMAIGAGFVDLLRLGEGVKQGGWGYLKDALRLLIFITPALRAGRWFFSLIKSVDVLPTQLNCTWVAATRLLRLTGIRPLMQLEELARAAGFQIAQTGGAYASQFISVLQSLGVVARLGPAIADEAALARLVSQNARAVVMFTVHVYDNGIYKGLHTLLGVRGVAGGLKIIDRGGEVFKTLANVLYNGVRQYVISGQAATVIVDDSLVVKSVTMIPTLANVVSQANTQITGTTGDYYPKHLTHLLDFALPNQLPQTSSTHHIGSHTLVHGTVLGGKTQRVQAVIDAGMPALSIGQIVNRSGLSLPEVITSLQELKARGKVILLDCPPGSNQLSCQVLRSGGNTLIRQMPR